MHLKTAIAATAGGLAVAGLWLFLASAHLTVLGPEESKLKEVKAPEVAAVGRPLPELARSPGAADLL